MQHIIDVLRKTKQGIKSIAYKSDEERNLMLDAVCQGLKINQDDILAENQKDIELAKIANKQQSFIDRLMLDESRIDGVIDGLLQLKKLKSKVGVELSRHVTDKGLTVKKVAVPLGVFCIIYEARPNVTADTIGLAIKSGNTIVLRGSKDAINTNIAIVKAIRSGLNSNGYDDDFIGLIEDTTHDGVTFLMKQRKYVDVIIPRGGKKLIESIVNNSLIPTIETGSGNCHIYVNSEANQQLAEKITTSAKISRVSVCNSAESLVIDREVTKTLLPGIIANLQSNNVEVRGDKEVQSLASGVIEAVDEDYYTEYNDYIMSVKIVEDIYEAIDFINEHSTHHSECIITEDKKAVQLFNERIDSACVYHNTSTRFSDGFEFGLGAEVGISTQKLHARGPMGIDELLTYKFVIESDGMIR